MSAAARNDVERGSQLTARPHELTAVLGHDKFDQLPGGVTSTEDVRRWRDFRKAYHAAQRDLARPAFPLQIDFELTSRCNLRCAFCTHGHVRVPRRELAFDDFARVIDEGAEHGLVSIKLNYINEPLLVRDLPRYVAHARSRGVLNTYFATNGLLLDEGVACELVDAQLSKVMVSLDAATPETFFRMRGSKRFDDIVHNVRRLIEIRDAFGASAPLVRVNFLKTPLNMHEADAFIAQWRGVADMLGFQDRVRLPGIEDDVDEAGVDLQREPRGDFRCSFPFKLVVVDSAGQVLPCCTFSGREMPIGSVRDGTIAKAWGSDAMRALQDQHATGAWHANSVCAACVNGGA